MEGDIGGREDATLKYISQYSPSYVGPVGLWENSPTGLFCWCSMRWTVLPVCFAILVGCDLFRERTVQLDDKDPVLLTLKAKVDAGILTIQQFEDAVSKHFGATTREIKDDFTATRAAIAEDLAKAAMDTPPPKDPSPMGTLGWIALVLIPALGAAAYRNLNSGIKKVQAAQGETISSTVATPGPRPAEAKP